MASCTRYFENQVRPLTSRSNLATRWRLNWHLCIGHLTDHPAGLIVRTEGRTTCASDGPYLTFWWRYPSPMARAFAALGKEAMASEVVAASANDGCEHEAMASDAALAPDHECCDHEAMPVDHAMKGCQPSADCIAKCFSCYAVLFSEEAIPSAIGGTEAHFVKKPFYSRTTLFDLLAPDVCLKMCRNA